MSNSSLSQKLNTPLRTVTRWTSPSSGPSPQWADSSFEVRCCLGWDIAVSVAVRDPKVFHVDESRYHSFKGGSGMCSSDHGSSKHSHSNSLYRVDNLVAGTCTSGQYYLRRDGRVCGDVFLSLEFFPNHQSLHCLAKEVVGGGSTGMKYKAQSEGSSEEGTRDVSLLMLLLGELVGMIRQAVREKVQCLVSGCRIALRKEVLSGCFFAFFTFYLHLCAPCSQAKSRSHLPPTSPVHHSPGAAGMGSGIAMGGGSGSAGGHGRGSGLVLEDFSSDPPSLMGTSGGRAPSPVDKRGEHERNDAVSTSCVVHLSVVLFVCADNWCFMWCGVFVESEADLEAAARVCLHSEGLSGPRRHDLLPPAAALSTLSLLGEGEGEGWEFSCRRSGFSGDLPCGSSSEVFSEHCVAVSFESHPLWLKHRVQGELAPAVGWQLSPPHSDRLSSRETVAHVSVCCAGLPQFIC